MKKVLLLITLLAILSDNLYAKDRYGTFTYNGINIGCNFYGLPTIGFDASIYNFYLSYSQTLNYKRENSYGNNGKSDDHRYQYIDVGFVMPINNKLLFSILPGFIIDNKLYNDMFYGDDVYEREVKTNLGGMIFYKITDYLSINTKISFYNASISVGFVY